MIAIFPVQPSYLLVLLHSIEAISNICGQCRCNIEFGLGFHFPPIDQGLQARVQSDLLVFHTLKPLLSVSLRLICCKLVVTF